MDKSATNINDIAKLAGVSRSTVSRVLTNNKNVKRETALRVKRAIQEANYRPNVLARGLATGKLNIVAMLLSDTDHPFYLQVIERMDAEIRERGYILSICYLGRTEEARCANFRTIQEYGFSGFIIGDIRNEPDFVETVKAVGQPLVFFNRYIEALPEFDAVVVDNYLGGHMVGKHLTDLGHIGCAVLTGPLKSSASRDRYRGFTDALMESGIALDRDMVGEGDLMHTSGYAFAEKMLSRKHRRFSAIFAGNDNMAIGVLNYCREHGVRVPEDVSIIGFDDTSFAGSSLVNLTTIQQPTAQMSTLTAERIVARINGDDLPRQCIMLEPRLIVRKTTGPV